MDLLPRAVAAVGRESISTSTALSADFWQHYGCNNQPYCSNTFGVMMAGAESTSTPGSTTRVTRDIEGLEHRIYRRICPTSRQWSNAVATDKPKHVDSIVLRYARTIGIEPSNPITARDIVRDTTSLNTYLSTFCSRHLSTSMVYNFAQLECFMLKHMPNKSWTEWLIQCREQLNRRRIWCSLPFRHDICDEHCNDEHLAYHNTGRVVLIKRARKELEALSLHAVKSTPTRHSRTTVAAECRTVLDVVIKRTIPSDRLERSWEL